MKNILLVLSFVFIIPYSGSYGQNNGNMVKAHQTLNSRGEVCFRFRMAMDDLKRNQPDISIDKFDNGWVYAYANKEEFESFTKMNIEFEVLKAPGLLNHPDTKEINEIKNTDNWDYYPTYDAYEDIMYQFQSEHPELCRVFSIGTTVEGRKLLFAKISDNVDATEAEPKFMYTSTMHGDETGGYISMLHLIDYLLSNYGSDDDVTNLVDNIEIWINPLANPDGTYAMGNNSVWGATRYNGNNIDLNRNYPDPEDGPHPDGNEWQPETEAFMALADSINFTMSANIHSGAEVCNYPWDTWSKLTADDEWWQFVCREYADTAQFYSPEGYMTQLNNGITNGYAWYPISGGRQDYMNYFAGCREFTLEMSLTKLLLENKLLVYWEYNYRSFLNYMKQVLYGFQGVVTDAETGEPVKAKLTLAGHDQDNSSIYSDLNTGSYFRPVYSGTYDLKFTADGYNDKVFENVSISNYETVVFNAELEKASGLNETALKNYFKISPNPVSAFLNIYYSDKKPVKCIFSLYSATGDLVREFGFDFSMIDTRVAINVSGLPVGVYFFNITTGEGISFTKKIIKE